MTRRTRIPFDGTPSNVSEGDAVECRTAHGEWVPKVAAGGPRYDDGNAIGGRVFLTVPVYVSDERGTVNWPAEDVRVAAPPEGHCGATADSAILGPCALPADHDGTTHIGLNGIAWDES